MSRAIVTQNYKTTWHTNPVSGHSWPVHENVNSFTVIGGCSVNEPNFRSVEKAQEHADYLNRREKELVELGIMSPAS